MLAQRDVRVPVQVGAAGAPDGAALREPEARLPAARGARARSVTAAAAVGAVAAVSLRRPGAVRELLQRAVHGVSARRVHQHPVPDNKRGQLQLQHHERGKLQLQHGVRCGNDFDAVRHTAQLKFFGSFSKCCVLWWFSIICSSLRIGCWSRRTGAGGVRTSDSVFSLLGII